MLWLVELMFSMQTLQVSERVVVAASEMTGTAGRSGSVVTWLFLQSCPLCPQAPRFSAEVARTQTDSSKFQSFTHHRGERPGLGARDEVLAWA